MPSLGIIFTILVFMVSDGDTLRGRTAPENRSMAVRIWGIDTPERGQPGYREAKVALADLALSKFLTCEAMDVNFDRIVARCRRLGDDIDIGGAQVGAGHARDCPAFSGGFYQDRDIRPERPRWKSCEVVNAPRR